MNHSIFPAIVLSLGVASCSQGDNNHGLRYDRPAVYFEEALPIGNGRIGAMVYGGVVTDSLTLNDITLWTGEPVGDTTPPDPGKALREVREALDREDYRAADSLQRGLQGKYSQNYQPLGSLIVNYDVTDSVTGYKRSLDIIDGVAETMFTSGGYQMIRRYYASAPDSVIVMEVETDDPAGINATVSLSVHNPCAVHSEPGGEIVADGYVAYSSIPHYCDNAVENMLYDPDRGIHFMTIVDVEAEGGTVTGIPDGSVRVEGAGKFTVKLVNATSFNGFDKDPVKEGKDYVADARRLSNKVKTTPVDDIRKRHAADFNAIMNRVKLDLGSTAPDIAAMPTDLQLKLYTDSAQCNPDLEELYFQYGRYLLASCSRTPGVPANLQGLWNESKLPPWSSNYTININTEENYWPANVTNLSEMEMPLVGFIGNLSNHGSRVAEDFLGADGWCAAHNSDMWGIANPVGDLSGHPSWANWYMGGTWLSTHLFDHYLFNPDEEYLADVYDTLKGAARFCLSWLVERDGELITSPGTSPENMYVTPEGYVGATLYGSTADLAFTRQCLLDTRDAAKILNRDADLVATIDSVLPRLRPYRVGANGNLQEWYHDWADIEPTHRHQSHLYGLFPGRHINPADNPDLCKAIARSLEIKGDETTGWSTGWRINLYARLLDKANAYHMYRKLLKYVSPDGYRGADARRGGGTYPNLFDAHSPFQIDGNFGGTAGVAEMLLQSTPTTITLLPALPDEWKEGSVSGLKARGGFTVNMSWRDGKVTDCTISSERGGSTTVRVNGREIPVTLAAGSATPLL